MIIIQFLLLSLLFLFLLIHFLFIFLLSLFIKMMNVKIILLSSMILIKFKNNNNIIKLFTPDFPPNFGFHWKQFLVFICKNGNLNQNKNKIV